MDIQQAKAEASTALIEVAEQLETILNHKAKIPQIEIDLILTNTQRLYAFLVTLNKLNVTGKADGFEKPSSLSEVPVMKQEEIAQMVQSEVVKLRDELFRTLTAPSKTTEPSPEVEHIVSPMPYNVPPTPKPQTGPSPEKLAAIKQNPFIGKTIMPNGAVEEKALATTTIVEPQPVVEEVKHQEPVVDSIAQPVAQPVEQEIITPPTEQTIFNTVTHLAPTPQVTGNTIVEAGTDNTLAGRMRAKPIASIKAAIGINEKFQYLNDLFKGSVQDYNESLDSLNGFATLADAETHFNLLRQKFGWDMENVSAAGLYELVVRRYLK